VQQTTAHGLLRSDAGFDVDATQAATCLKRFREQQASADVVRINPRDRAVERKTGFAGPCNRKKLTMKFNLDRFVTAQQNIYEVALSELRAGLKRSHWMWFIFPQLRGLGRSETARFYAISGRAEAEAYLTHPMLGPRLVECTTAMLRHTDLSAHDILGSPDDLKFRSSMTLFGAVAERDLPFQAALDMFYAGVRDESTLRLL